MILKLQKTYPILLVISLGINRHLYMHGNAFDKKKLIVKYLAGYLKGKFFSSSAIKPYTLSSIQAVNQTSRGRYLIKKPAQQHNGDVYKSYFFVH